MFNRYWRSYPWYFQLFQFLIMAMVMLSFFSGVLTPLLVPKITGYEITAIAGLNEASPEKLKYAALLMQGIFSIGLFAIVPLLFAYVTHPRPAEYLGLRKPGKAIQPLLVILLMVGLIPVEIGIQSLIQKLPWPAGIRASEQKAQEFLNSLVSLKSGVSYLLLFFVVAIVPAVGEELFFRGIIMRMAAKIIKGIWGPLLLSSVIFALIHASFFNFTSILLAGIILGLIYYRTGSLWMNILGHCVNNGAQVLFFYLASDNVRWKQIMESNDIPLWLVATGFAIVAIAGYAIWKNSTPLPPNWSDDYAPEELAVEKG